jgi:hypothetical protein
VSVLLVPGPLHCEVLVRVAGPAGFRFRRCRVGLGAGSSTTVLVLYPGEELSIPVECCWPQRGLERAELVSLMYQGIHSCGVRVLGSWP